MTKLIREQGNENRRDTQFAGFAKALRAEMDKHVDAHYLPWGSGGAGLASDILRAADTIDTDVERLIAQRAYDLVLYTLNLAPQLFQALPNAQTVEEVMRYVPDLVERNKQAGEEPTQ